MKNEISFDVQEKFIHDLQAVGKPMVMVNCSGSAVALTWESEHLPALLQAWYPGEQGGNAIADVGRADVLAVVALLCCSYLGGHWLTVDPRNFQPRIGRILIARGRDAADVAISTTFGPNRLSDFQVWTDELP